MVAKMRTVGVATAALLGSIELSRAFSPVAPARSANRYRHNVHVHRMSTALNSLPADADTEPSRRDFIARASSLLVGGASLALTASPANADERMIKGCVKPESTRAGGGGGTDKKINCVSTANVKQVDLYSPPWTFDCTTEEAFARLKGAVAALDKQVQVREIDEDGKYILFEASRGLSRDTGELLVRGDDKVVTFKVSEDVEGGSFSDLGAQRKLLESIRKSAGVFDVMGAGITADSYGDVSTGRGGGALGQLKAFYGLQSGGGYEQVFDE
mmetsp:Transcript_22883/g.49607  ORF Transcript_22883/g.49607 Transcript_22883/m.49607 type:complete len:272 (+) Transcript_22883:75-890(+)